MYIDPASYVQNHVHFALAQKNPQSKLIYTVKTISIVKLLTHIGCIHHFLIIRNSKVGINQLSIWVTIFFYRNTPFFKSFRLLSTPSKRYTITVKALRLLNQSIGASTIILSTSYGLLTHQTALERGVGGLLLFILS